MGLAHALVGSGVLVCLTPEPCTRNPKSETRNPKPETRNPKPETRHPKPETRNPKPETRNPKPETRNPKPEQLGAMPPRSDWSGAVPARVTSRVLRFTFFMSGPARAVLLPFLPTPYTLHPTP